MDSDQQRTTNPKPTGPEQRTTGNRPQTTESGLPRRSTNSEPLRGQVLLDDRNRIAFGESALSLQGDLEIVGLSSRFNAGHDSSFRVILLDLLEREHRFSVSKTTAFSECGDARDDGESG